MMKQQNKPTSRELTLALNRAKEENENLKARLLEMERLAGYLQNELNTEITDYNRLKEDLIASVTERDRLDSLVTTLKSTMESKVKLWMTVAGIELILTLIIAFTHL